MARLSTNYEGAWDPRVKCKWVPLKRGQHKSLACCVVERTLGKEEGKDEAVTTERDIQVMAEEELEEVDLGFDSQEPRPISISASLTETEKSELILPDRKSVV